MKVIKNKSNNQQLKHCEYFNTWISTYKGWTHSKFEIRANFESNCGSYAQFGLYNSKIDENVCQNGCIDVYFHKMDCINDNYYSGFHLSYGQNFYENYILNKTQEVRLKSHKN